MKSNLKIGFASFFTDKKNIILLLIFLVFLFLRFYKFEELNPFGWDQVDNAWAAKNIIVDHNFPLVGMVAKGNSGFYIGPAYYYFISSVYYLTNLDPIASGIIAGITSIFSFIVLYVIAKKLFNFQVAVFALFINTLSIYSITFDRIQWPVNFIAPLSLIVFFALYKVMLGKEKYLILLAMSLGFFIHIHFTAIFFPICVLLSIPFISWNRNFIKYGLISLFLFVLWLFPNIIHDLNSKGNSSRNLSSYIGTYYHGFHITRVMQLANDAFIELEGILYFKIIKFAKFLILPFFFVIYFFQNKKNKSYKLLYLFAVWFIVPWFIFSVYNGEISNYYFSSTRFIGILALAYILFWVFSFKNTIVKLFVVFLILLYGYFNLLAFKDYRNENILQHKQTVMEKIKRGEVVPFTQGNPDSFLYYIYTRD